MYKEITPDEVEQLVHGKKDVNIIDVREHEEVAQGKIPGAYHIPLGELESRLKEVPEDKEHIMVCRSGARSGRASEFLAERGYNVKNMSGGMLAWKGETEK
ncbi:rhodanese-like domain-containing protein [Ectobacillus panaciterrae]|uniref:rhodanese-like domain-containing protein n=1 Tax=Ectobacillus panaciterrae TaxID=363872 RepID=UPI00040D3E40|nr:rhodanese-like domain-containing protein [Ectobacillus panaciterrae]